MKKTALFCCFLMVLSVTGCNQRKDTEESFIQENVNFASEQMQLLLNSVGEYNGKNYPRTTDAEGRLVSTSRHDWTPGFFPGALWYLYELTGDKKWVTYAEKWTYPLEPHKSFTGNHDIGFMMYCSYGNAFRLKPEPKDKEILINSSESLCARFSPEIGLIRSWDFGDWSYPVIIDNMMNLEMLFWASEQTGNSKYRDIAIAHADKTLKNHFRENMTSYHVVSYSVPSGKVESKGTFQGYADSSAWARGQAWGVYGYTMCYRFTKKTVYLEAAHKIARFIMENRPSGNDYIPYWDYDAPDIPNAPRDASAAAVTASALLELYAYTEDQSLSDVYIEYAENILKQLSSPDYLAKENENKGFILMHSVGSFPHDSEVNVPLNYADYYYLEAMKRYKDLKKF